MINSVYRLEYILMKLFSKKTIIKLFKLLYKQNYQERTKQRLRLIHSFIFPDLRGGDGVQSPGDHHDQDHDGRGFLHLDKSLITSEIQVW